MSKTKKIQLNKKWVYKDKTANFSSDTLSGEMVSILSSRGVISEAEAFDFLDPTYDKLSDPFELSGMDTAVAAILEAIENKEKITIYGDYDVDGITSTALLLSFFKEIGIAAEFYIPSRQNEGYGLNVEAMKTIADNGTNLIITVDCGSTSIDEINFANSLGLKVVVTDHHTLKQIDGEEVLPEAVAIVNPRRSGSLFSQELAGVGVAFYLARAIQSKILDLYPLGQEKWLLDLVALGTICDVVPLLNENRILASFGLKVLSKSKRLGIKALAQVSNFELKNVEAYQVGFLLGPRLNAAGRLETAHKALNLLLATDENEATAIADELNQINLTRQEMTEKILEEARKDISSSDLDKKIYLLSNKNWPSGIVGIVASRLVDEFCRPVLVMEDLGGELKGSARSIKSFNIVEALGQCKELLSHYGGHAYAAGFSLPKDHFVLLDTKLIEIAGNKIKPDDLVGEISIDKTIELDKVNTKLIEEIKRLEPYGQGNLKPIFVLKNQEIKDLRFVGNPAIHLKLTVGSEKGYISGMIFSFGEETDLKIGDKIDLALTLEENVWRDKTSIEFRALDFKLTK